MSNEVRVGSLEQVNNLVYGEEHQGSIGLIVIISGVDTIRNAPGMLSQLEEMEEYNDWSLLDKSWMKRVVEISSLLSNILQCSQQLGQNIQEGLDFAGNLNRLRGFKDAVQHLREGPIPPEIRSRFRHLRTLLDRRFSTEQPIFQPTHLQQQCQDLVAQLMDTSLVNPAFQDGPGVDYITFEEETQRLLKLLATETTRLSDFQKNIFLDELLANSAHSLDMVKLSKDHADSPPLLIEITINKENKTFAVRDTGIGMTRSDLINKLSKVALSRTKEFMQSADDGVPMTDQMGIGFFSCYFVANKVAIATKHDNEEQYTWEARSNTSYTISANNCGKSLGRGTKITLHLKPDQSAYLDLRHVTEYVKKRANLFDHEVYLVVENAPTHPEADDATTVPEAEDLELVSGLTPGCNQYRFRLIKNQPLLHKRNSEVGEPEQRKKRKLQQ